MSVISSEKKWNKKQVGGLYKRQARSGKNYLAGFITLQNSLGEEEKYQIEIFPNRNKEKETHFDYCIYNGENQAEEKAKGVPDV